MPLRRHRAASQADQKLALLAELAIRIDGKQPGTASLTMAQVGVLMEQRGGSPGRADAIAAVQSALGAPAPGGSTHDRFYSKAMGKQGNQAAAYAAALVPGVPEALADYVAARADAATDAERARALNAAMKRITAAALPAPTHDEYRTAVGCAAYRANGMRLLTMVPTPGFVYLQKYSLSADVVEQLAVSLGPACLLLGKPNGATLVWFNHVTNVNRARVVGAVDPGSNVDVYRVGKSSTENPHAAGKRVNEHSFCWNGSDWELDKRSDAFLLTRWSTVPGAVEDYAQQYVAVGPPGNSEPGELLLAELLGADQISGNPFVNVSPCGPSESDPYLSRGGPGQAPAVRDWLAAHGGLRSAFDAPAGAPALHFIPHPMLALQVSALLQLLGGGATTAAIACEAAARAAAATAGACLLLDDHLATVPTRLSIAGAAFVIEGSPLFATAPMGPSQVRRSLCLSRVPDLAARAHALPSDLQRIGPTSSAGRAEQPEATPQRQATPPSHVKSGPRAAGVPVPVAAFAHGGSVAW